MPDWIEAIEVSREKRIRSTLTCRPRSGLAGASACHAAFYLFLKRRGGALPRPPSWGWRAFRRALRCCVDCAIVCRLRSVASWAMGEEKKCIRPAALYSSIRAMHLRMCSRYTRSSFIEEWLRPGRGREAGRSDPPRSQLEHASQEDPRDRQRVRLETRD